jgi:hypothetical protein
MDDLPIDGVGIHLAASKNLAFKDRVRERFTVFINFLQTNGLTTRVLLKDGDIPNESTTIMKSDLTDEGFEVVRLAYDRWLRGLDRGKPVSDVSVLEKAIRDTRKGRKGDK